jgi:CPA1 family monovalent cation:H+ antiporter
MHMETTLILGYVCTFLFIVCAAIHYSKNSSIHFATWILLIGVIYGTIGHYTKLDLPQIGIRPDIVFYILLPILIFESAQNIKFQKLREVGIEVMLFATVGMLTTAILVAVLLAWLLNAPIVDMLLFGIIIASTDPVAVLAIFRRYPMPEKLKLMIEGESLLNDGTVLILYSVLVALVIDNSPFVFGKSILQVIWAFGGSILLGAFTGLVTARILQSWHESSDNFISPCITIITALMSFLFAEYIMGTSGVIAVMTAAMTFTNSQRKGQAYTLIPQNQRIFSEFWKSLGAIAHSILFFLLGVEMGAHIFAVPLMSIVWVIIVVLVSRSIAIYACSALLHIFGKRIMFSWQHILNAGGLKGALAIALILMLPKAYPHRTLMLCSAFIVVLFTLIINTAIMQVLLKRIDLSEKK